MIEPAQSFADMSRIGVAHGRILAHEIKPLDLPERRGIDHLDDRETWPRGDGRSPCVLEPCPLGWI